MRHAGIPLPEHVINNDLLFGILLLISMSMLLLLRNRQSLFTSSLHSIYDNNLFFAGKITMGDQLQQYTLLTLSIVGISFFATRVLYHQPSWQAIGITFTGICLYFLIKLCLMQGYFRLFFGNNIQEFMYKYTSLNIVLGIGCFVAYIGLIYAPLIPPICFYTFLVFLSVIFFISITYILFQHFFNRPCLIFHFILYLCTLELLPVLLLVKWAL